VGSSVSMPLPQRPTLPSTAHHACDLPDITNKDATSQGARLCAVFSRPCRAHHGRLADWPTGRLAHPVDWHIPVNRAWVLGGLHHADGCMAAWCMAAWLHGVMASIMDPWNMA
jgi:hypothetical protein